MYCLPLFPVFLIPKGQLVADLETGTLSAIGYDYSVKVMLRNRNAASVPVFPSCLGNCVCEYLRVLCSREITGRPRGLEAEWESKERDLPLAEFQIRGRFSGS